MKEEIPLIGSSNISDFFTPLVIHKEQKGTNPHPNSLLFKICFSVLSDESVLKKGAKDIIEADST